MQNVKGYCKNSWRGAHDAGNNGMVTINQSGSLDISEIIALERNPAAIFITSKLLLSRKDYHADLDTFARLLGAENSFSFNRAALRYHHAQAIRTILIKEYKDIYLAY
jgi:hypothetical protein